ncbi:MAG: sugar phosphate isomerase/epimerase [Lachnospiraceae bacterium]|nr:sugar phosphate isomerase/epimerase [Lachnospiraceae bacterium]
MKAFPIGIILDSFRKPILESLDLTAQLGADGIQVYATRGEMAPENLKGEKRRDFLREVKARGLRISALCGDLGHGFWDPERNPELIERSKLILDMAKELETDVVTTHIGVVPADPAHPRYKIMQDACGELASYADRLNAHFAIETGPETSLTLKHFLDSLHSTGVAVNLDPANLVMVTGDDPVQAVYNLKDYIVHTHAKDGVKLGDNDPEVVYGIVHKDALVTDRSFEEVPLGEGDVPFKPYLEALEDIGFGGFLTIEREVGPDPAGDIAKAVAFLKSFM